jgi:hypothetical protein
MDGLTPRIAMEYLSKPQFGDALCIEARDQIRDASACAGLIKREVCEALPENLPELRELVEQSPNRAKIEFAWHKATGKSLRDERTWDSTTYHWAAAILDGIYNVGILKEAA